MAFDFKKEYKEYYLPQNKPEIIEIPAMNFIAVRGCGNPNAKEGAYQQSIGLLYGIAYTIKMSYLGDHRIEGFFQYVVPPLEGFWWMEDRIGIDYDKKEDFQWISCIRLPDFVQEQDIAWAIREAGRKKKQDFSKVTFFSYREGCCVQCMHIGSYDLEMDTIRRMERYAEENGYAVQITPERHHHEIYLSDARKGDPAKWKTVIRHPVKQETR